jgi:hypothetical protein
MFMYVLILSYIINKLNFPPIRSFSKITFFIQYAQSFALLTLSESKDFDLHHPLPRKKISHLKVFLKICPFLC